MPRPAVVPIHAKGQLRMVELGLAAAGRPRMRPGKTRPRREGGRRSLPAWLAFGAEIQRRWGTPRTTVWRAQRRAQIELLVAAYQLGLGDFDSVEELDRATYDTRALVRAARKARKGL